MRVLVFGAAKTPAARETARIKRAVLAALGRHRRAKGELCLVFVDDRRMRAINRRFLGHDAYTDVVSFRHSAEGLPAGAAPPFGDIYVAKGVARRQARALGHSWLEELLTLSVHGALHLAGYDDTTAAERRRMFRRQDAVVRASKC